MLDAKEERKEKELAAMGLDVPHLKFMRWMVDRGQNPEFVETTQRAIADSPAQGRTEKIGYGRYIAIMLVWAIKQWFRALAWPSRNGLW